MDIAAGTLKARGRAPEAWARRQARKSSMAREAHRHGNMIMRARQGDCAERELKFVADRKTFKTALALPLLGGAAEVSEWRLKSVYFDTEDGDLMLHGV